MNIYRETVFISLILQSYVVMCLSQSLKEMIKLTSMTGNPYILYEGDIKAVDFNITLIEPGAIVLLAGSSDREIIEINSADFYHLFGNSSTNITVNIHGLFLGRAFLNFHSNRSYPTSTQSSPDLPKGDNSSIPTWYQLPADFDFEIVVKRKDTVLNTIFTVTIIILVCLANIAMGCKTELEVVKETLKKPIAPLTGLTSQFIIMPMVSFAVGYALGLEPAMAFGFFAMGCSPGGAASNIYTYLLDGDVSLSVTMTFISTILSMAMIPVWFYSIGINVIYKTTGITIPFENIVTSLLGLIIPVAIGVLIQKKRPSWAKKILLAVKPLTVIFVILVFTVGVYANLYIFRLLKPLVLLSGAIIPYCGFAFGGLVAFLTRHPKKRILTIAIETGIQNSGVAIVLLQLSIPPPDDDIGVVGPIVCTIFTPIPMVIAIVSYEIYKRCFKKKEKFDDIMDKDGIPEESNESLKGLSYTPVHKESNNTKTTTLDSNNSFEQSDDSIKQQHVL